MNGASIAFPPASLGLFSTAGGLSFSELIFAELRFLLYFD